MKPMTLFFSRDANVLCILEPEKRAYDRMQKQQDILRHDEETKHNTTPHLIRHD